MSGHTATVGNTLAGGIQDVAALFPLIGTEQCEVHVGSALKGGYLYAAATPLSIFGSLGIVKVGISILFSSISISIPKISFSFHNHMPKITYSGQRKWLGATVLNDAGFKLCGSVAPLMGTEGQSFKAEARLTEILDDMHIDNPARLTVDWKSRALECHARRFNSPWFYSQCSPIPRPSSRANIVAPNSDSFTVVVPHASDCRQLFRYDCLPVHHATSYNISDEEPDCFHGHGSTDGREI